MSRVKLAIKDVFFFGGGGGVGEYSPILSLHNYD